MSELIKLKEFENTVITYLYIVIVMDLNHFM